MPERVRLVSNSSMRLNHLGRRLHELDQNALTTLGSVCTALGMDEAHFVAGGSTTDPARCETDALCREPLDGASEIVDPETHVVERRLGRVRPRFRIDGLHEVDLDGERSQARPKRVFFDVFALDSMARYPLEAEEIHPKVCKPLLVRAAERDLLHSENPKRPSVAQYRPWMPSSASSEVLSARMIVVVTPPVR
jgi:hypothetical protein